MKKESSAVETYERWKTLVTKEAQRTAFFRTSFKEFIKDIKYLQELTKYQCMWKLINNLLLHCKND